MVDMKIRDEELSSYASHISELGQCIESRISGLKTQLEMVCENGVISGDFHDNLLLFVELLNSISEMLNEATNAIYLDIIFYLQEIDRLDGSTY